MGNQSLSIYFFEWKWDIKLLLVFEWMNFKNEFDRH